MAAFAGNLYLCHIGRMVAKFTQISLCLGGRHLNLFMLICEIRFIIILPPQNLPLNTFLAASAATPKPC